MATRHTVCGVVISKFLRPHFALIMYLRDWEIQFQAVFFTILISSRVQCIANICFYSFLGASVCESQQPYHPTWRTVELTKPTGNGYLHIAIQEYVSFY